MLWYAAISVLALAKADPLLFKPGSGYHLCPDLQEVCSDDMDCCHQADNTYKCCAKTDKAEDVATPANVICPDRSTCPAGNTCCSQGHGLYGCCPYSHGVCCPDGLHCCPYGTRCHPRSTKCYKAVKQEDWFLSQILTAPTKEERPEKGKLHESDVFLAVARSSENSEALDIKVPEDPDTHGNLICPDGRACFGPATCCNQGGYYACCPRANAKCCADGLQCCPAGSYCDDSTDTCIRSSDGQRIDGIMLFLNGIAPGPKPEADGQHIANKENVKVEDPSNVICPDGSTCPGDHTCCNQGGGHFGCCPMGHAVCCPDGRHCCPYGTLCNPTSDKCCHSDETQKAAINFVIMLKSNRKL